MAAFASQHIRCPRVCCVTTNNKQSCPVLNRPRTVAVRAAQGSVTQKQAPVLKQQLITTVTRQEITILFRQITYCCCCCCCSSTVLQLAPALLCCRLNSAEEADDRQLQQELLSLVEQLASVNPTPRPAESSKINGRWVCMWGAISPPTTHSLQLPHKACNCSLHRTSPVLACTCVLGSSLAVQVGVAVHATRRSQRGRAA